MVLRAGCGTGCPRGQARAGPGIVVRRDGFCAHRRSEGGGVERVWGEAGAQGVPVAHTLYPGSLARLAGLAIEEPVVLTSSLGRVEIARCSLAYRSQRLSELYVGSQVC